MYKAKFWGHDIVSATNVLNENSLLSGPPLKKQSSAVEERGFEL